MKLIDLLRGTRSPSHRQGVMGYGRQKADGSHDHRSNKGKDRTPAQKSADAKRTESR